MICFKLKEWLHSECDETWYYNESFDLFEAYSAFCAWCWENFSIHICMEDCLVGLSYEFDGVMVDKFFTVALLDNGDIIPS